MSLKLNDEIDASTFFNNLMKGDASVALELTCLASNIEKELCGVLNFSFFWKKYEKKNHNIITSP
jgi:hypothetical protein